MLLDHWNGLITSLPLPVWFPGWATTLVLPVAALVVYGILSRILPFLVRREHRAGARLFVSRTRFPVQSILLVAIADATIRQASDAPDVVAVLDRLVPLIVVFASAVLAYRSIGTFFVVLRRQYYVNAKDNLKAREAMTQLIVLERVLGFAIVVVAIAIGLMTIPEVRRYGTSLLASAGVVGLVVGFAAQQTIANVIAGIQIAVTQPLRINDAVVIDGEWGRVEEITLTYVVVRIWDQRRMVVPISYLLQKPFQNWTRTSASLIGSVYLHVDHTIDLRALRTEQTRVLAASDNWNGEVDTVQVVDSTEKTILLRCLASATDSASTWDLRCEVREKLIEWITRTSPEALPRERMRIQGVVSAPGAGPSR